MAGFGFDADAIKAAGTEGDMYVVIQVVLTEKFIGAGSGVSSLTNLQRTINEQGFRWSCSSVGLPSPAAGWPMARRP